MDLLMNGLLTVATLFAGGYCWVLARRVRDLKSLDKGLGGAIVTLTRQIELARATLDEARAASKASKAELQQLVARADAAAGQLRLLLAASPTVPASAPAAPAAPAAPLPPEPPLTAAHAPAPIVEAPPAAPPRKAGALLTMLGGPAAETPEAAEAAAEVPKPRALVPIENPLRRFRPDAAEPVVASEEDILETLRALAGPGR
jgi:hypothetical protein